MTFIIEGRFEILIVNSERISNHIFASDRLLFDYIILNRCGLVDRCNFFFASDCKNGNSRYGNKNVLFHRKNSLRLSPIRIIKNISTSYTLYIGRLGYPIRQSEHGSLKSYIYKLHFGNFIGCFLFHNYMIFSVFMWALVEGQSGKYNNYY